MQTKKIFSRQTNTTIGFRHIVLRPRHGRSITVQTSYVWLVSSDHIWLSYQIYFSSLHVKGHKNNVNFTTVSMKTRRVKGGDVWLWKTLSWSHGAM